MSPLFVSLVPGPLLLPPSLEVLDVKSPLIHWGPPVGLLPSLGAGFWLSSRPQSSQYLGWDTRFLIKAPAPPHLSSITALPYSPVRRLSSGQLMQPKKKFFPSVAKKSKTQAYSARTWEEDGRGEKRKKKSVLHFLAFPGEARIIQKLICQCIILPCALSPLILQITA